MTQPATTLDPDALARTLGTPAGRRTIWGLLGFAGLFRQPRVAGDPGGTDFNCGGLNVGLMLYADCLTVSPDLTAMMIKEQGSYDNDASLNESNGPELRRSASSDAPGHDSADELTGLGFDRLTGRAFGDSGGY